MRRSPRFSALEYSWVPKLIKGGDCYNPLSDVLENCVMDKIDGSTHPEKVVQCTGEWFWYNIPKNTKVPNLEGKYVCLKRSYDDKEMCNDHCPNNCSSY